MEQNNVEILVKIRDEASSALSQISKKVTGATTEIQSSFVKAASASKAVAIGIGVAAAAITAFGVVAINAARESIAVQNQLAAVLKSTGSAAGVTATQAIELATAYQKVTNYSDEAILGAENLLLTFTKIKSDIFPKATKIVLDMSAALGQDLKGSAIQVGKALQDPILGVTALRRVGVNFNSAQQEVIKNLVETGKAAEAQAMIMKELETEFGGSAEAIADPITQMKNAVNDAEEALGILLLPAVKVVAKAITDFSAKVTVLIDKIKEINKYLEEHKIVIFLIAGAIAGALIPAFIGLAAAAWAAVPPLLAAAAALLPFIAIGVAVGAAIYVLYKLWKANFGGIQEITFKVLDAIGGAISAFVNWTVSAWNWMVKATAQSFIWLGKIAVGVVEVLNKIPGVNIDPSGITKTMGEIGGAIMGVSISFKGFTTSAKQASLEAAAATGGAADAATGSAGKANEDMQKLQEELVKKEADAAIARVKSIEKVREKYQDTQGSISDSLYKMKVDHEKNVADINKSLDSVTKNIDELNKKYKEDVGGENKAAGEAYIEQQQKIADLNKEIKETLEEAYSAENFSTYTQKLADLRAELAKEEAALKANANLEITNAADIAEAKRRASLTEFQRNLEDIQAKKDKLKAEHDEKLAQYQQDRADLELKLINEVQLYNTKEAALKAMRLQAATDYEAYMNNLQAITADSADKMVAQMQRVLDMRSKVEGSGTVGEVTNATSKKPTGYSNGGVVGGSGYQDTVPALLTPREEVITVGDRTSLVAEIKKLLSVLAAGSTRPNVNQNVTQVIRGDTDAAAAAEELMFRMRTARFT